MPPPCSICSSMARRRRQDTVGRDHAFPMFCIATFRTIFPLGTMQLTV